MRWHQPRRSPDLRNPGAPAAAPVPDCWLAGGRRLEIRCLGTLNTDRMDAVDVWLWFAGAEGSATLTADELGRLGDATRVRPVDGMPPEVRLRLAQRIGRRRTRQEHLRWGLWSIPVDELEAVMAGALTRSLHQGHRMSPAVA